MQKTANFSLDIIFGYCITICIGLLFIFCITTCIALLFIFCITTRTTSYISFVLYYNVLHFSLQSRCITTNYNQLRALRYITILFS